LVGLHPLTSWLVVMALIVTLSLLRLRVLALVVGGSWTAVAIYNWGSPSPRRQRRP
jgi:hypothetical protein